MGNPILPVWLLDVDGVLCASRPGWGGPPRQAEVSDGEAAYKLRWAPELMVRLARLHRAGTVEFRWATTWVDWISKIEAVLRLPPFPVAFSDLATGPHIKAPEAKAEAALRAVEQERRPLIWTDDDAIPAEGPVRDRLLASGQPFLLITPDPRRGLQPGDLDAVSDFLRAARARPVGQVSPRGE